MLVLIQIISVITYSLSIANVAQSRKNKYLLWDFASIVKNGIVSFDHNNSNFTTTLRHAKNNYFQRKFTECSNNSRDTWKTLNRLIRYKNTSKDVILNHGGSTQSTVSNPSAIAEVFNNYIFFKTLPPILIPIFLIQIYLHWISWEHLWKIHFFALPLIGKKLLI